MITNTQLQATYDRIYSTGSKSFFTVDTFDESLAIQRLGEPWAGLRVLEIGCGEGRLAALISMSGAEHVRALDYSAVAIKTAKERYALPNLDFLQDHHTGGYTHHDRVVMQGVLEHMDDWRLTLCYIMERLVHPGGMCITSSPCFLNPRGYVWMAMQLLLDVPMSLTDKHAINPWEIEEFCEKEKYTVYHESIHRSWGGGDVAVRDFQKRLPLALRDAGLSTDGVDRFLCWFAEAVRRDRSFGATMIYRISKP